MGYIAKVRLAKAQNNINLSGRCRKYRTSYRQNPTNGLIAART